MNANFINFHKEAKDGGLQSDSLSLISDEKLKPILEKIAPELKKLDQNRVLFGFPKTLNQVHMLRAQKIYPNKIFIINSDESRIKNRLIEKLGSGQASEGKVAEILDEYSNQIKQIKDVYRDITFEIDDTKGQIVSKVTFDLM